MIVLGPGWKTVCTVLQFVPLAGIGAIIAGHKNPQTTLLRNGVLQLTLFVLGAPLVLPALAAWAWAGKDAMRIRSARPPGPLSRNLDAQESPTKVRAKS